MYWNIELEFLFEFFCFEIEIETDLRLRHRSRGFNIPPNFRNKQAQHKQYKTNMIKNLILRQQATLFLRGRGLLVRNLRFVLFLFAVIF